MVAKLKIRAIVAVGLIAVPYLLLFAAGSIWLYQYHVVVWWFGLSLAATWLGWQLLKGLRREPTPPLARPDPMWPPDGMAAWKGVEELASAIEAEDLPLDRPDRLLDVVRRVVEVVARHYHPESPSPWLEAPVPYILRIIELAIRDLRQATMSYVPAAHLLTVRDWQRLWDLAGWTKHAYLWYRIVTLLLNTPAAVIRESRDLIFDRLKGQSAEVLKRWAVGFFVRRVGYYAIQLYGKYMLLDDSERVGRLQEQTRKEAADSVQRQKELEAEPFCFLVVGQVKAGKSSLINALFGNYRAAIDVIPRTAHVEPYVLESGDLQRAIILDTAGYDDIEPKKLLGELSEQLFRSDVVLCVCAATSAARNADRVFLDSLCNRFRDHPDRHTPAVLVVVTKIDQLRPLAEWNPPYCLCPPSGGKAEQIASVLQAVSEDLVVDLGKVVPVCLKPGRVYNVEEGLVPAILEALPQAERVRYLRCLRYQRKEEQWTLLWRQAIETGRVILHRLSR